MIVQLKEALNSLIDVQLGIPRISDQYKVANAWNKFDNLQVIQNAAYEKYADGILYLSTNNSAWTQHVNLLKPEIISKLNQSIGKHVVKDIRFRAGANNELIAKPKKKEKKVCPVCGVTHEGDEPLCAICFRHSEHDKKAKLFRLVNRNPKIDYSAAKDAISGITETDYKRVKRDLRSMKVDDELRKRKEHDKKRYQAKSAG